MPADRRSSQETRNAHHVGRKPATPLKAAGMRHEPPVSVQKPAATARDAIAVPVPQLLPTTVCSPLQEPPTGVILM